MSSVLFWLSTQWHIATSGTGKPCLRCCFDIYIFTSALPLSVWIVTPTAILRISSWFSAVVDSYSYKMPNLLAVLVWDCQLTHYYILCLTKPNNAIRLRFAILQTDLLSTRFTRLNAACTTVRHMSSQCFVYNLASSPPQRHTVWHHCCQLILLRLDFILKEFTRLLMEVISTGCRVSHSVFMVQYKHI